MRRRAEECRHAIETPPTARRSAPPPASSPSAGRRAPPPSCSTTFPPAPTRPTAEALRTALAAVAVRDGKPEPALVRALTDEAPARRAAAGVALCRAGATAQLPAIRKLLQDPDPQVRLRVGLALADLGEKEAVPVLIALLDALPRNLPGAGRRPPLRHGGREVAGPGDGRRCRLAPQVPRRLGRLVDAGRGRRRPAAPARRPTSITPLSCCSTTAR